MSTCDVFDAFLLAGAGLEVLLRQKPATPGASGAGAGAAGGDLQMEEEALVMVVSVVHSAMLALLYCSRLGEGEAEISTVSSSPFGEGGRNRGFCRVACTACTVFALYSEKRQSCGEGQVDDGWIASPDCPVAYVIH